MARGQYVYPLSAVRDLASRAQGLAQHSNGTSNRQDVLEAVQRVAWLQIDTLQVVRRSQELVLWSRLGAYDPDDLARLAYDGQDRHLFEGWQHAACFLPLADYRFQLPAKRANRSSWGRMGSAKNRELVKAVLARIEREGPMRAGDFDYDRPRRGSWWDWKPAKRALECLFNIGELMISERRKFQRVYDLAERVLPATVDTRIPESDEAARWAVRWTLGNLGVAGFSQNRYWPVAGDSKAAVEELVESGEVVPVQLKGSGNGALYTLATTLEATAKTRRSRRVHLLSPFDNLVIRRDWLSQFFGFDYTLECYVPARKRRYGYFCLPILWGDRFVGRLDPKAERKKRVFAIRRLHFEPEVEAWDALLAPLARKTVELARFNGCDRVRLYSVRPAAIRMPLRRALDDALREA